MPKPNGPSKGSWTNTRRLLVVLWRRLTDLTTTAATRRSDYYEPYPPQAAFHAAGADHSERLFMAGNQLGKTLAGAMEVSFHLTGAYPPWWAGRVFARPVRFWAASDTAETTRDTVQRQLLGPPFSEEDWGGAAIPKRAIVRTVKGRNAPGVLAAVIVRHKSGGDSVVTLKSYDQGRVKWQGETLDGIWFDEEPPLDIYAEGRTRVQATGGITLITFTPLLGMSEVVRLFLECEGGDDRTQR